ncbi:MAG: hypothetical protein JWO94_2727 [Verrucomicrobiaceae bacterium]|nr:hypothetical protein [Verrucomicrobiaceae bacterium]
MKNHLRSLGLCLALALPSLPALAGIVTVANDSFANAFTYTGTSQTSDTSTATIEAGEPSHYPGFYVQPFHSVWWKYTPLLTGIYQIDTANSSYDTVLAVYTGTTVNKLTRIAFNGNRPNGNGDTTSSMKVFLTKGVTYHFAVDGFTAADKGYTEVHVKLARYATARTYQGYNGGRDIQIDSGGIVSFTVADTSALTGKLILGGRTYAFTSSVDDLGAFSASVVRPGLLPVSISGVLAQKSFTLTDGVPASCDFDQLTLTMRIGEQTSDATVYPSAVGDVALKPYFPAQAGYTAAAPCPRAGKYSYMISAEVYTPGIAVGYGVATLSISPLGICTATGHLGEGTAFSFTAPVLDDKGQGLDGIDNRGHFVFSPTVYAGLGRFGGEMSLYADAPGLFAGTALWIRPAPAQGTVFLPKGIVTQVGMYGSHYIVPGKDKRMDAAFDTNNGAATFTANRPGFADVTKDVVLSIKNVFTSPLPDPNLVKLTPTVTTGALTGSVKFTGAPAASAITATLIQFGSNLGFYGYLPGTTGYGKVAVTPTPQTD